jgi:hypothetical protein
MMMLPKLFDFITIFVMALSFGALASPVAKPEGEIAEPASNLTTRNPITRWTWYNVQTGNQ